MDQDAVAAHPRVGARSTVDRPTLPLTQRLVSRLPGNRLGWTVAWGMVPWLNLAVVLGAEAAGWTERTNLPAEVANRLATSFAILLSLWGAGRISDDLQRLRPALAEVVAESEPDVRRLFTGLDSTAVPLILTAVIGVVLPLDEALRGESLAAVLQAATWLLIGIPLCTAVWVYVTLQLGLHRLGRGQVTLLGYRGDRTLGLQPVGSLAFTGFWTLAGVVTPLVLTGSADLPSVLVGILVLLGGVLLFFLSLRGLHRQMASVKQREVDRARNLYREAYESIAEQPTLETLQQQTSVLNAAEALEKRAERIQAWPFDEGTFARVVTIASSTAATIIARLLLAPTGM